jgi:hypothetical protein
MPWMGRAGAREDTGRKYIVGSFPVVWRTPAWSRVMEGCSDCGPRRGRRGGHRLEAPDVGEIKSGRPFGWWRRQLGVQPEKNEDQYGVRLRRQQGDHGDSGGVAKLLLGVEINGDGAAWMGPQLRPPAGAWTASALRRLLRPRRHEGGGEAGWRGQGRGAQCRGSAKCGEGKKRRWLIGTEKNGEASGWLQTGAVLKAHGTVFKGIRTLGIWILLISHCSYSIVN